MRDRRGRAIRSHPEGDPRGGVGVGESRWSRTCRCGNWAPGSGLRSPVVTSTFPSKHAIYDALFAQANEELSPAVRGVGARPPTGVGACAGRPVPSSSFSLGTRCATSCLFQRTKSPASSPRGVLCGRAGVLRPGPSHVAGVRCHRSGRPRPLHALIPAWWPAALERPGGDRWTRQLDRVLDMYLASSPEVGSPEPEPSPAPTTPSLLRSVPPTPLRPGPARCRAHVRSL